MSPRPLVLVVDDDLRVANALARTLAGQGLELALAHSVAEAQRWLGCRSLRAVLSDLNLPRPGGLALLREARRRRPDVARVVVTGQRETLHASQLAALAVDAVIGKPWDAPELRALLRRLCRPVRSVAPRAASIPPA